MQLYYKLVLTMLTISFVSECRLLKACLTTVWHSFQANTCSKKSSARPLYLPTFSEIWAWDFYPGSARIFEDDTIISEVFRRSPKSSEDVRSLSKAKLLRKRLSTKSEIVRKVLSFIHFTHGFRSLYGSELTYFWKLCQARWQQLTFFNQAWEIGP